MAKSTITNQLLRDAIADADALRETAIANAKITLEESFTPQIKAMLARNLRVQESETVAEEKAPEKPLQDAEPVGDTKQPEDTSKIGSATPKNDAPGASPVTPSDATRDSSDIDQGGEGHGHAKSDWYNDWNESDFDLDEVIKELEEDVAKLSENHDEEEEEEEKDDEEGEEDHAVEKGEEGEQGGKDKSKPFGSAQKPSGLQFGKPQTPPDEQEEDEGSMPPEADAAEKATDAMAKKGTDNISIGEPTGADHDGHDEELDLESVLAELDAEEASRNETHRSMTTKIAELESQLQQYKTAFDHVRGNLKEVNLLNAKLLYTNRLFRQEGLNSEQKVAIVENFDRATTVREVKMVYTTLVETLNVTARTMKSRKTSQVVTEGLASKTIPSAPKPELIVEEDALATRLKQLAGIL